MLIFSSTSGWNMMTLKQHIEIVHYILGQEMNNTVSNWNFRGIKPLFLWWIQLTNVFNSTGESANAWYLPCLIDHFNFFRKKKKAKCCKIRIANTFQISLPHFTRLYPWKLFLGITHSLWCDVWVLSSEKIKKIEEVGCEQWFVFSS